MPGRLETSAVMSINRSIFVDGLFAAHATHLIVGGGSDQKQLEMLWLGRSKTWILDILGNLILGEEEEDDVVSGHLDLNKPTPSC